MMLETRPVFVVDDDVQVLDSVRCLLSCEKHTVRCFVNPSEFLKQLQPEQTGCLVTDLSMPEMDGLELQQVLRSMNSMLSLVIVTGRADVGTAVRLMRNGAVTLLEKPYPAEQLLEAVNDSLALSEDKARRHRQKTQARHVLSQLTADEREVVALAAEGLPNKAIAQRLTLSPRTVDRRRQSAFNKLGIATPAGYARLILQAEVGGAPAGGTNLET